MKALLFGLLGMFALTAVADTDKTPKGLAPFQADLIEGLTNRAHITINMGELSECTRSDAGDMTFFHCKAKDAVAEVQHADLSALATLKFDKVSVSYRRTTAGDTVVAYYLNGTYTETIGSRTFAEPAQLDLEKTLKKAPLVRGYLKVPGLAIQAAVREK